MKHRVKRDGDRDIVFAGERVGGGTHGGPGPHTTWARGTDVDIYVTEAGRYVIAVRQWSRWEGEDSIYRAAVCETAEDVHEWLVEDCGGVLGRASKEAIEDAASSCVAFAAIETEEVA